MEMCWRQVFVVLLTVATVVTFVHAQDTEAGSYTDGPYKPYYGDSKPYIEGRRTFSSYMASDGASMIQVNFVGTLAALTVVGVIFKLLNK